MNSYVQIATQIFYPIILLLISFFIAISCISQEFYIPVAMASNFDPNSDPIWFVHMSDLHLAPFLPKAIENSNKSFSIIKNYIKPYFLIITGDIVDNYGQPSRPRRSDQFESNYRIYQQLIDQNGLRPIIFDLLGNHDVVSISKERNNKKETLIHKYFVTGDTCTTYMKTKGNVTLIALNPASYPTGVGSLGIIPTMTKRKMDSLDIAVQTSLRAIDDAITILATHTPTSGLYFASKSSSLHTFDDLLETGNIKYVLNGHSHPEKTDTFHHRRFVEYTSVALKFKSYFSVFSIDNGHPQYSAISTRNTNPSILTYPAASIYENEIMRKYDGAVRVVSFSNNSNNFVATITNLNSREMEMCILKFVRNISNEASEDGNIPRLFQCSFPQSKSKYQGKNELIVEGDLNTKIEFNVNEPLRIKERQHNKWNPTTLFSVFALGVFYHIFIFATIFIPFTLQTVEDISHNAFLSILLGPILTGYKLKSLNKVSKIILCGLVWSPLVLPIGFFFSDGHLGFMILWGYFVDGSFTYDVSVLFFGIVFYFTTAIAIEYAFLISMNNYTSPYSLDLSADSIIYLVSLFIWFHHGTEIAFGLISLLSFPFIIIPSLTISYVYIILKGKSDIRHQKLSTQEINDNDSMFELIYQESDTTDSA